LVVAVGRSVVEITTPAVTATQSAASSPSFWLVVLAPGCSTLSVGPLSADVAQSVLAALVTSPPAPFVGASGSSAGRFFDANPSGLYRLAQRVR
jgi:hypothetical protein